MSKGALSVDKAAHTIMEFEPTPDACGVTTIGIYTAFYHEERLYSVRNMQDKTLTLVYASSPKDAISKAARPVMNVTQNGNHNYSIANVGTLNL